MAKRLLAIRADGGPGIGSGHLARCLALALAWQADGGRAVLLTDEKGDWLERYEAAGVGRAPTESVGTLAPDWVVIDGYRFGPDVGGAAREAGALVLIVDDHGFGRAGSADALLDQNLGASAARYRGRVGPEGLLLGPRFALLRPEFATARPQAIRRRTADRASRVLLSSGGDPPRLVVELFEALGSGLGPDHEVRWLRGVADVTSEMLRADMAIAASGSTCWELCCIGVPMSLVPTTENQQPVADALGRTGVALHLGPVEELEVARALVPLRALSADVARRRQMAEAGRALVDGRGARRVVAHLRGALLTLRPVSAPHARLLWRWVNDPATRAASFDTAPIPWEVHQRWLSGKLGDPGCTMYLADDDGVPVGQIRFDARMDRVEIGVSVAPELRGRGWGPALVDAGTRRFFADHDLATVVALVKPENVGSAAAFEAAGFQRAVAEEGDRAGSLRYVCQRHDAR